MKVCFVAFGSVCLLAVIAMSAEKQNATNIEEEEQDADNLVLLQTHFGLTGHRRRVIDFWGFREWAGLDTRRRRTISPEQREYMQKKFGVKYDSWQAIQWHSNPKCAQYPYFATPYEKCQFSERKERAYCCGCVRAPEDPRRETCQSTYTKPSWWKPINECCYWRKKYYDWLYGKKRDWTISGSIMKRRMYQWRQFKCEDMIGGPEGQACNVCADRSNACASLIKNVESDCPKYGKYCPLTCELCQEGEPMPGRSFNTRDYTDGPSCREMLECPKGDPNWPKCANHGCPEFLKSKDCDKACGLDLCSTATNTTPQHCSGHGECQAECTEETCTGSKCKCETGWCGDKCETWVDGACPKKCSEMADCVEGYDKSTQSMCSGNYKDYGGKTAKECGKICDGIQGCKEFSFHTTWPLNGCRVARNAVGCHLTSKWSAPPQCRNIANNCIVYKK